MKRAVSMVPVLLLCLLGGVLGLGSTAVPVSREKPPVSAAAEYEEPVYRLDTMTAQNAFAAEDGRELARYSYQLLTLSVVNMRGLSGDAAALAERNIDQFNEKMIALMDESVEVGLQMGEEALDVYEGPGGALGYYDETAAEGLFVGQMISVRVDHSSYAGGAHPNTHAYSYLFDLQTGQFIDPVQIADNPERFHDGAGELLIQKAEELEDCKPGVYWSDYAEVIRRWNEGTVLFDGEGMSAVFSPYDLGPYSMGEIELRLCYDELRDLVGENGMAKLGAGGEVPLAAAQ